ncbi:hypothetical protein C3E98_030650, partial [Pseudomonas sp. MWU13-2625]
DCSVRPGPADGTGRGAVVLVTGSQAPHANVAPKISAGAAAIGAAIINPLLGVGVLAANYALSETLSHAFALDYAITGSWAHPHIERVRGDQGKMNHGPAAAANH